MSPPPPPKPPLLSKLRLRGATDAWEPILLDRGRAHPLGIVSPGGDGYPWAGGVDGKWQAAASEQCNVMKRPRVGVMSDAPGLEDWRSPGIAPAAVKVRALGFVPIQWGAGRPLVWQRLGV